MNSDTAVGLLYASFGIFFIIFILVFLLFFLVFFLLQAFGLYRIAQRKGIEHAWLAWIPIAQTYLYAEIIGQEIKVGNTAIPHFPWAYLGVTYGASIIAGILSVIPFFGAILAGLVAPLVYLISVYVMYLFFKLFKGDDAVVYTVICAIFSIVFPIMVLILRDKPFAEETVTMKNI